MRKQLNPDSWMDSHPGAATIFVMGGIVVVGGGLKLAAPVFKLFLLAAFIAIVSSPMVSWQRRFNVPRIPAVVVALLADAVVLGALGWLAAVAVGRFAEHVPGYIELLVAGLNQLDSRLQRYSPSLELADLVDVQTVVAWTTELLQSVAGFLSDLALAFLLAMLLMVDLVRPRAAGPAGEPFRKISRAVEEVNKYIAIKTVISMATGLLIGIWLYFCGAELPVLLGLVAFLLNFIPNLGSIIASLPGMLLGLLEGGFTQATIVGLGYLIVNMLMGNVIEPRVMGRALGLSTSVVVLSVVLWGWLLGPIGALLSALLTVLLKVGLSAAPDLRSWAVVLGPVPEAGERQPSAEELADIAVPRSPESQDPGRGLPSSKSPGKEKPNEQEPPGTTEASG